MNTKRRKNYQPRQFRWRMEEGSRYQKTPKADLISKKVT